MKVRELIGYLQKFDSDSRVVVNGYEGGFDDIEVVEPLELAADVYVTEHEYMGRHELVSAVKSHDSNNQSLRVTKEPSDLDAYVTALGSKLATFLGEPAIYIGKKKRRI